MKDFEIEELELDLLLECIYRYCGYDFRNYARASVFRNIRTELNLRDLQNISELIPLVLHHPDVLNALLRRLSINVTEFYRNHDFFSYFRQSIFPILKTFPFFKIWHAGCASGEEVYSLAILLHEADLLKRARIYATDFNHDILEKAQSGLYPTEHIESFSDTYRSAGGQRNLQDYFTCKYDLAKVVPELKKNITFAHHNLVTDGVFGDMQVIICRNVLIYFDRKLKAQVLKLFYNSLSDGGILCLGNKESLHYIDVSRHFESFNQTYNTYKKSRELMLDCETGGSGLGQVV